MASRILVVSTGLPPVEDTSAVRTIDEVRDECPQEPAAAELHNLLGKFPEVAGRPFHARERLPGTIEVLPIELGEWHLLIVSELDCLQCPR